MMPRPAHPSSTLGRLLEAAGYRVEVRPDATVASRSRDHRSVVVVASARSPVEVEAWFPPDAVHRTIVYDDEPGPVARALAADRGIEVLEPSTLGPALGEILLPAPASPGTTDAGVPSEPNLEPPFPVAFSVERTVRPRIGREEAEAIAGVDAPRYLLRLVPFYVAAYRVRPASPSGGAGRVVRQIVAVNAISRTAEIWDDLDRELVDEVREPHQRFVPQIGESEANPIARDAIRRHHTVQVDHTEQHGGALVIEARRIPPAVDDIRVGPFVLLYVPYWYAEGTDGRVVLDAVTGRRVTVAEAGTPS
jgi:hypothetical protein